MERELQNQLGLPAIDQIGFVVPDMKAAVKFYDPLFGPFRMMDTLIEGALYRGREEDCKLQLAFGKSGDIEIELIAPAGGEGPHQEFIDAGGNGIHHMRYRVIDHDQTVELVERIGFKTIWTKRMAADIAVTYLEREGDPLIIEILQMA